MIFPRGISSHLSCSSVATCVFLIQMISPRGICHAEALPRAFWSSKSYFPQHLSCRSVATCVFVIQIIFPSASVVATYVFVILMIYPRGIWHAEALSRAFFSSKRSFPAPSLRICHAAALPRAFLSYE
jgi:hypothetical protein